MHVPTVAEVDAIVAMTDPVARNAHITQGYHDLARAVAVRLSPGANWCAFATWASRQAGQTIRGEDVARAADEVLGDPEVRVLLERVVRLAAGELRRMPADVVTRRVRRILDPEAALRRAADAVALGNRNVFGDIARVFARWLATAARDGAPDAAATAAFCAELLPGEPPQGQRLLREAFTAYGEACATTDADARAELLLLGNLLVALHEQTRAQPEIAAAVDAGLDADAVRGELLALLLPGFWLRLRAALARRLGRPLPLDAAVDTLVAAVRRRLRAVITRRLMTLRMPDGTVVRLGDDVRGTYPPALQRVEHAALRALLTRLDPTPHHTGGSGATDWASLDERLHFIADLFRCWQARPELFDAPHDAAQADRLRAGRRSAAGA